MIIALIIISLLFVIVTYKYIKLGKVVINLEDEIERCLDIIDQKYGNMTKILNRPLFLDSPEVKSVVNDINDVRKSLHQVAYTLSSNFIEEENDQEIEGVDEKN